MLSWSIELLQHQRHADVGHLGADQAASAAITRHL
jgi:hypothetical protein